MMVQKILLNLHKLLGILLCLLFFMWFASGIVMIDHSFPRASAEKRIKNQSILSGPFPDMEIFLASLSDSAKVEALSLEMYVDRPVFYVKGKNVPDAIYADSLLPLSPFSEETITKNVAQWCTSPIQQIDTLYTLDQWIPFGHLKKEFPIYKYKFADPDRHELYISSKNGNVLQFTDKDERFWAWLGAIPHWVYFTFLRQNQPVWINFVKWTSGIGTIMCLSGLILGILIGWKSQKKSRFSPYKKRWYHWHYLSGLLFGLCAATFAFSGMMSLMDIPDWMKKAPKEKQVHSRPARRFFRNESITLSNYIIDFRDVLTAYGNIKKIEWLSWNQHPYYRITNGTENWHIDASGTEIRPFMLSEELVREEMQKMYKDSISWKIEYLSAYDSDYFYRKKDNKSLPVYRVTVDDDMHTRHYYNPQTLMQRRIDDDARTRHLLYRGLHCLDFKFLTDRPLLWYIVMYTLLIGGTFLSATGCVLSFKWLIRKIKRYIL